MRLLILLLLAPLLARCSDAEPSKDQRSIEAEQKKATEKIGPRSVERAPVRPKSLLQYSELTFRRSTIATEIDAHGKVYNVQPNVLRWDPTGEYARFEQTSRQALKYTEDISQDVWVKANCTVQAAPFLTPREESKLMAQSIVATAAGDATITQPIGHGRLSIGNCSAWVRSDGPPQQVTLQFFNGTNIATKTVTTTDSWQRIAVVLRNATTLASCRIGILNAAPGARVSVWGINVNGGATGIHGQLPSYWLTESSYTAPPGPRAQDILIAQPDQVPAHMLSRPWGFKWRPQWANTAHGDATLFSVKNLYHEIVWASARVNHPVLGTIVHGQLLIRASDADNDTSPVVRSQDFSHAFDATIEVHVNPLNGHIKISGATTGNGRGVLERPWTWPAGHSMWIGERNGDSNTHGNDSFLSEPYAVEPF